MPKPIAICIEDLDPATESERYLRCVAVGGTERGLSVDVQGAVLWQQEAGAFSLVVSLDERLVLLRPEGAAPSTVSRGGRCLEVPCGKPVVLIDQDRVDVGGRRLRVHVHGEAPEVHAPAPLPAEEPDSGLGNLARAAATALAIGAAVGAAGCKTAVEVRDRPPTVPEQMDKGAPKPDLTPPKPDASVAKPDQKAIEVRHKPPIVVPAPPKKLKPQPAPIKIDPRSKKKTARPKKK